MTFRQAGYWKNTETLARRGIALDTGNVFAHNLLGVALEKQGKIEEARQQYLDASKLNPRFADPLFRLGTLAFGEGDNLRAIKNLKQAAGQNPKHYRALSYLGQAYAAAHNIQAGCETMLQALIVHPSYEAGRMALCKWNAARGHLSDSIRDYKRIVDTNPTNIEAINNLGILLVFRNRKDEAAQRFQSILSLHPENLEAKNNLGVLRMHNNQTPETYSISGIWPMSGLKGTVPQPSSQLAKRFLTRGQGLQEKGHLALARQHYLTAMRLDPLLPGVHMNLGNVFFEEKALQRALNYFTASLKLLPDDPRVYNSLGVVFVQAKKYDQALAHFSRALKLNPGYTVAQNNIQKTLRLKERALIQ
jgi:tetratricopeptide (TPR) repeat protein